MRLDDTIYALSSGAPPSGIAVLRLSGPAVPDVVRSLAGPLPDPRRLVLRSIRLDDEIIDKGMIAYFPAPQSFTGEACAEFHLHGSVAVVKALLAGLSRLPGLRHAEAGEFTRRAFENGKLDATEVEGLGDMLVAETENQRRQALLRMRGGLSSRVAAWREQLLDLRAEIEAHLDFSDEGDVGTILPQTFSSGLQDLQTDIELVLASYEQGRLVRDGVRIALAGPPNSGKSSLLNALVKSNVAIVTSEAGTTRDVREVLLDLNGHLAILVDMAGLRETDSIAEAEGIRRAKLELQTADLVLWLVAPDVGQLEMSTISAPTWIVNTKSDLKHTSGLAVSALTGDGVEDLGSALNDFVERYTKSGEPVLVSHERDRQCLGTALSGIAAARLSQNAPELAAESLRLASRALERLVGKVDVEAVLDRLFSGFCIGK